MSRPPADGSDETLHELLQRGQAQRRQFRRGQPKPLSDVIAQVINQRGYAQIRAASAHRQAWQEAAGPRGAGATEPGAIRPRVLEVVVAANPVMQELVFDKERLLAAVQQALPDAGVKQLRFKVGQIQ